MKPRPFFGLLDFVIDVWNLDIIDCEPDNVCAFLLNVLAMALAMSLQASVCIIIVNCFLTKVTFSQTCQTDQPNNGQTNKKNFRAAHVS